MKLQYGNTKQGLSILLSLQIGHNLMQIDTDNHSIGLKDNSNGAIVHVKGQAEHRSSIC